MGIRNALRIRAANAVPPGAPRPSMTMWWDPGGTLPPVSWVPPAGMFETHWDWDLISAFAVPGYWKARMLISQAIGGMPLGAWKGTDQLEPTPAVLREPSGGEDRCTTVAAWVGDLLDHGNAIGFVAARDAEGRPTALEPWPSTSVAVGRRDGATVYVRYVQGKPDRAFGPSDVFHARGVLPYPGALRGMGVLEAGLTTLTRMRDESAYAANAFRNGVPAGLLKVHDPDLQPGTADDPAGYVTAAGIKRGWKDSIATGDIAVLSELMDFTPLGWNPSDAQMVEARQLSLVDVANLFALDPFWVGSSQQSAPYQNVQDAAVQLVRFTLTPWIVALEAQLSRMLARGTEARFNRDTLLRQQRAERVTTEIALLQAGVATVDEVRAWEGMPPLPEGADTNTPDNVSPLFPAEADDATNAPAAEG